MKTAEEWFFEFGLINQEGDVVTYEEAESLLDAIIAWAEERGFGIGGGFSPGLPIKAGQSDVFALRDED